MASAPLPPPPKIFLSYSHDSPEHMDRVLDLCDRLRADGVDAWLDQYETAPAEGWPRWCARRVAEADFVLVVCTEVYERRFRGEEAPGEGLGARWEGYVVVQELYDAGTLNAKYIPVLWSPAGAQHVPLFLRGTTRYDLRTTEAYQSLYRHLTGQPKTPAPPLGGRVPMPPREREPEGRPAAMAEPVGELKLAAAAPAASEERRGKAPTRGSEPAAGEEQLHKVDGTVLLYVPSGEYTLGAEGVNETAKPVHRVVLSPFWIAKYLVTNEQYGRYLGANPGTRKPEDWTEKQFNQPQQPVVGVSWEEAQAYCRWAGLRLPSEAQWEAAARGTDGRRFPWGNAEPTHEHANFESRKGRTTPVGSYPKGAGPFGALDQAGNVWEWCEDVWDAMAYRERDGQRNPVATTGFTVHVRCLRGGSWRDDAGVLAVASRHRFKALNRYRVVGFRCVLPVSPAP